MPEKEYTPALGYRFLTPVYDLAVRLLTRERRWRGELARLIDPRPGDRILDVGFREVEEPRVIPTATGSISLYTAMR